MVFNNEGQDSCVLLGNPERVATRNAGDRCNIAGKTGVTGSRVKLLDKAGKLLASHQVSGGDGRGGQAAPTARFALDARSLSRGSALQQRRSPSQRDHRRQHALQGHA